MGRGSDLMIEGASIEEDWFEFLARFLSQSHMGQASSYRGGDDPDDQEGWEMYQSYPDLDYTDGSGKKFAVAFRMFRWRDGWIERIRESVKHIEGIARRGGYDGSIVITTLELSKESINLFAQSKTTIWGLGDLRANANDDKIVDELEDLISETILNSASPSWQHANPTKGAPIADRMLETVSGRDGFSAFETCCLKAIQFLFSGGLANLRTQNVNTDRTTRMDIIARIKIIRDSFWSMIANDFHTRYVVFEAKNYSAPISQSEIYSTEKYLFTKGLRTVAVIIARNGADSGAERAAVSALRENGKLILVLSMGDLVKMLHMKDVGELPEDYLFELMDNMFMKMGR